MQEEMSNEEIIKKIGMSKATFYRRLKECRENPYSFDDDTVLNCKSF